MKQEIDLKYFKNLEKTAWRGFLCQCILCAFAWALFYWSASTLFHPILCLFSANIPIWLLIFCRMRLFVAEAVILNAEGDLDQKSLDLTRKKQLLIQKVLYPFGEVFFAAVLLISGIVIFLKTNSSLITLGGKPLLFFAFSGILSFGALMAALYFNRMTKSEFSRKILGGGVGGVSACAFMLCIATVTACGEHLKIPHVLYWGCITLCCIDILAGLETGLKIFFRFFRPRKKGELLRPAFDSYIFETLKAPSGFKQILLDVINQQLGFEVSKSAFSCMAGSLALPLLFFSVLLMLLLSCIVIVAPSEKALILRFGNVSERILGSGIHLKAPWPVDIARKFDLWEIRSVHVGSHQPQAQGGEIYKKDQPILWTNLHGVVKDELLIVAPPADLMKKTMAELSGKTSKAPSISLAGADILIEYRISNIKSYLESCANPENYFKQIAEGVSSRALYQYDIDSLFCEGRVKLPESLKKKIQKASDNEKLGIEVLNVAMGGVHPPQDVASAFQETVAALQEKETSIQWARQYAVRNMIETVGSMSKAQKLIAAINASEKKKETLKKSNSPAFLLHNASGYVAQILAEASSYRWERENLERGRAERFAKELKLYDAAPKTYMASYYMSILESGLGNAEKYMLVGNRDDLILRFDFKDLTRNSKIENDQEAYFVETE